MASFKFALRKVPPYQYFVDASLGLKIREISVENPMRILTEFKKKFFAQYKSQFF